MIIFPELCISGYMVGDLWQRSDFVNDCSAKNGVIARASKNTTIIWGNVAIDKKKKNKDGTIRKYNAAFVAQNGKLKKDFTTCKTYLPDYHEFYDNRHFSSLQDFAREQKKDLSDLLKPHSIKIDNQTIKIGITLCEDLWWQNYGINIADQLKKNDAAIIVSLSCSPWHAGKTKERDKIFRAVAKDTGLPLIVCNATGVQDIGKTVITFDGGSAVYNKKAEVIAQASQFEEEVLHQNINKFVTLSGVEGRQISIGHSSSLDPPRRTRDDTLTTTNTSQTYHSLIFTLQTFLKRIGKQKVVIGLSGGIDSAVTAALCAAAIGPQNVYAINLATKYNSKKTISAAKKCAASLGINYSELNIDPLVKQQITLIESTVFNQKPITNNKSPLPNPKIILKTIDQENVQSRTRGSAILSALAGNLNAVVICCGNKTELAFGYTTLYGDLVGATAPLGDLLKTDIYKLGKFINVQSKKEIVPKEIFDLPPSAELSPNHNINQGKGDPFWYPYHDQLVRYFVEERLSPDQILKWYKDKSLAKRCKLDEPELKKYFPTLKDFQKDLEHKWSLLNKNVFKRFQAPPVIKVRPRCFGFDLQEAQL